MKIRGTLLVLLAVLALELLIASGGVGWVLRQAESLLGGERLAWAQGANRLSEQQLERAKFDANGNIKVVHQGIITAAGTCDATVVAPLGPGGDVAVEGTIDATIVSPAAGPAGGLPVEIVDPAPTANGMPVDVKATVNLPITMAKSPKQPTCTTLARLAATDASPTVVLPASADGLYLITVIGADVAYLTDAAPAAAWATDALLPDGFIGYLELAGAVISMDCNTGLTAGVSIKGCTY